MKVLVCGSRTYKNALQLGSVLEGLNSIVEIEVIVEGEAKGADKMARWWAEGADVPVDPHPADWETFGKSAGYLRNVEMLNTDPDLVIAFFDKPEEESRGTAMMCKLAEDNGTDVWKIFSVTPTEKEDSK